MNLARKILAEFLGTFAIVFMGCGAITVGDRFPGSLSAATVPLIFGLTVAAMIYAVGHISGAHFNPAVTLAFWSARHFPGRQVFGYMAGQMLGALAAVGLLVLLLPAGTAFGATVPSIGIWQAWAWEFLLTFFLMFVIIAVATDTRAVGTMAGAAIGATVTVAAYVGGPLTGASLNPARSFAPAIAEGRLDVFWIYAAAPILGALAAAKTYEWIRCDSTATKSKGDCCSMNILFMCVANSARSQLAEGLARSMFGSKASFYSAGSQPSQVNPLAIKVLKEISLDISHHKSKTVKEIPQKDFDYVITLCAEEVCPVFLGKATKLHWPFPDPAGESNPEQAEIKFRHTRDMIKEKLELEIPRLLPESDSSV